LQIVRLIPFNQDASRTALCAADPASQKTTTRMPRVIDLGFDMGCSLMFSHAQYFMRISLLPLILVSLGEYVSSILGTQRLAHFGVS
jgi:hypothetical protein